MDKRWVVVLGGVLVLWSIPARADVVWPALFLEIRLLSIPAIAAGLVIEWIFYFFGLGLTFRKAAVVDVVINTASALVGILAIPIAGLVWEFFPGILMYKMLNIGTFNPITWSFTYAIAVIITTSIEIVTANKIFKLPTSRRNIFVFLSANAASVGVAFASLISFPLPMG